MPTPIENYRKMVEQPWVYSNEYLTDFFNDKMTLSEFYGIRTFYGLSSNNEIKYTQEWYNSMLELETRVGSIEDFKKVSFFNHLIFEKRI